MAFSRVDSAQLTNANGQFNIAPTTGQLCVIICGLGRQNKGSIPTAGTQITVGSNSFTEIGSNQTGNPSLSMFFRKYEAADSGTSPTISGMSGAAVAIAIVYSYSGTNTPAPTDRDWET